MFPDEMDGQRRKLMGAIAALVGTLDHPEMFRPVGSAVDRWHALLGVTSSHLAPFADALLWTLERHFVASFSPALRQAWAALCEALRSDIDIPSGRHRIAVLNTMTLAIGRFLENPVRWEGTPTPEERRIILDRVKQTVSKELRGFCVRQVRERPQPGWQQTYAFRGKGHHDRSRAKN